MVVEDYFTTLWGWFFPSTVCVGSRNQTDFIGVDSKCLYLLSLFTGPVY